MICFHRVRRSRSGSPGAVTDLTKRNRLTRAACGDQKGKASMICVWSFWVPWRDNWRNSENLSSCQFNFPNITGKCIPEFQADEKSCQKEKRKCQNSQLTCAKHVHGQYGGKKLWDQQPERLWMVPNGKQLLYHSGKGHSGAGVTSFLASRSN